jgi:hypothetical protein
MHWTIERKSYYSEVRIKNKDPVLFRWPTIRSWQRGGFIVPLYLSWTFYLTGFFVDRIILYVPEDISLDSRSKNGQKGNE